MRSEHPASEAEDLILRGRVLGGLAVTRAFGDAYYKWPREVEELCVPDVSFVSCSKRVIHHLQLVQSIH
jgi:serine/threonine protein phosphatase PrpC